MKILTLRDNTGGFDIFGIGSIVNGLSTLFGGESMSKGGYDVTGRFIPGDLDNRLQFLAAWMSRYKITSSDIDKELVDSFIYQPSGWQGQVSVYVQQVAEDKKLHPEKYANNQTFIPDGGGGFINPLPSGFGKMNITTILLIGAGVFMLAQVLGKGKRRR